MERSTIDFGIDLGTTNSAVALLRGVSTDIIKNNQDADITPSVVGIDKRGAIRVGAEARDLAVSDPDNAYSEFKRQMGADNRYQFKRSGLSKKPEELSAEILKELRGNVHQRLGEHIDAAVITVPAAFELHQCDATRKAAELAGFLQSPLVQEPVAAALAYGFQVETSKAYWLVYDFGGGTFDAAVIKAEEGTVRVVNHGGDNFLGGSDIDWSLINTVFVPYLVREHGLNDFNRGNPRWRTAFAVLKRAVERAKIRVSRDEKVWIDECRFQGESGEFIELDYELTKQEVAIAAEPLILRSGEICRRVLEEKRLAPGAIEKMILVGGPTLAPYFRARIQGILGIPLEHGVDPLTVVARGAAVFAGTQRRTSRRSAPQVGEYSIDLKHKPVGLDSSPLVGGRVSGQGGGTLAGFTLEIVAADNTWRSGKLPITPEGVFTTTLRAERGKRNQYAISLYDPRGQRQKVHPDSFTYTVGAVVDEQPLINSMGVAFENNEFDRLLEKGRGLPAKVSRTYATSIELTKGQKGAVLRIPICEGEAAKADRNKLVGTLTISGDNIARDLPIHSEIEITLEMDASRIPKVRAYVPLLDADFEATLGLGVRQRDPVEVRCDVEAELERLEDTMRRAQEAEDDKGVRRLEAEAAGPLVTELTALVENVENVDAAQKCEHRLLELKCAIDEVADRLEWPKLVSEAHDLIGSIKGEAEKTRHVQLKKESENITRDLLHAVQSGNADDLRVKMGKGESIYSRLLFEQPAFWVYQFQQVAADISTCTDKQRAARLCDQGRAFLSQNSADGLKNVVLELWRLMPTEAAEEGRRGYQSGIVKGRS